MFRNILCPILSLIVAASLLVVFGVSITIAAPLLQGSSNSPEGGQEYVVQRGDWLSKISQKFYGSTSAWQVIIDATNAKAATDERFVTIENPDTLKIGQVLWIPDLPAESKSTPASAPIIDSNVGESKVMSGTGLAGGATISSTGQAASVPMSATIRFVEPQNGSVVPPRFDVTMAAEGLIVEPASAIHEGAGHFHILVDTDFVTPGELIPLDEDHLHLGKGQMTTTLELKPGVHTLRLQFANGAHIALEGAQYRDTITVTVANGANTSATTPSPNVTAGIITSATISKESESPEVRFVEPQNGSVAPSRFDVTMAAKGLTVEPAGEIHEGAGHFHILIDTDFVAPGEVIPVDENHLHLGKGQTTATLELKPGVHVLRLQFANGAHIALEGTQYQDTITVTVRPSQ